MNLDLNKPYSRDSFLEFLDGFLPDFSKDIRPANKAGLKVSNEVKYLGESEDLDLAVFELIHTSSNDARVSLATDGFKLMKDSGTYRALIAYKSEAEREWRLSLLTASPKTSGGGRVTVDYSNPRRYSFYLGPDAKVNTPYQFLVAGGEVKDIEDLKSRFSIEVVNKEFFIEISEQFIKLVGGTVGDKKNKVKYKPILKLPSVQDRSRVHSEFAVRLIGRVIFCWFLREKKSKNNIPLMPKELLSLEAVKEHKDYYHSVLEPIFFEVLNKKKNHRMDSYVEEPFSLIPYLNGGLFSPHDDDYYKRLNGDLQSRFHNTLIIPNKWFIELFELLETYNFTIDENTTFDEELSIDPEMLGRIFENLLAEINPETGESIRKSTGSFYTPRIIVDYMVDESLVLYLKNHTEIPEEKLRAIVTYDLTDDSEHPLNSSEKQKITDAMETVKLLDPACGSGAFPIGALQKMVFVLQQIDPDGQMWFKKQLQRIQVPELKKKLEKEHKLQNFDYIRKLGVIRENIYGVDIQPIATEISRLRCFLTLVVDQYVKDGEDNRGIEPLPNLEFKFVTANTLIGLPTLDKPMGQAQQTEMFDDRAKIEELKDLRDQYFAATNEDRLTLMHEFAELQKSMYRDLVQEHGYTGPLKAELTDKLTDWNPFSHKSTTWFDPEWMFGLKDGFDIVIGNPPYDVYQGNKKDELKQIKKLDIYEIAKGGKLNMYKLFLARSAQLQKDGGILCEIFQNSFLGDGSAKYVRKHFFDSHQIVEINSFPERDDTKRRVFEAVKMSVCILLSSKNKLKDYKFMLKVWDSKYMESGFSINFLKSEILRLDPFSAQIPLLEKSNKELFVNIYKNHSTAPVKVYEGELNMTFHKKYFVDDDSNPKVIKGAAVQRYRITDDLSQGEVEYVDESSYLSDYNRSKKSRHHELARVVMQGITGVDDERRLIMTMLEPGNYCANSCNYILSEDPKYDTHFLLGVYNSTLLNWLFKKTSTNSNVNCYEVENLPIPKLNSSNNTKAVKISDFVRQILDLTSSLNYPKSSKDKKTVSTYESKIDSLVFDLYGLTDNEIQIILNTN